MSNLKESYYKELLEIGDTWFNYDHESERELFLKKNEFCTFEYSQFSNIFFNSLISAGLPKKILYIQNSSNFLKSWPLKNIEHELHYDPYNQELTKSGEWDTVIADTPWGWKGRKKNESDKIVDEGIETIVSSLDLISNEGIGIYYLPSYHHIKINKFQKRLLEKNFHINSIIQMPHGSYEPGTRLRGIMVFVSMKKCRKIYIAEFEDLDSLEDQFEYVSSEIIGQFMIDEETQIPSNYSIISNEEFLLNTNSEEVEEIEDLWHGVRVDLNNFLGFENYKSEIEIDKITSDYAGYKKYSLLDLSKTINSCKYGDKFSEEKNSIYIPSIGRGAVNYEINSITLKHQNIFQIILDKNKVYHKYLASFFNSSLGIKYLEAQKSGGSIQRISLSQIKSLQIPVPSIDIQSKIIETNDKINSAINEFEKIKENLSINPISSVDEANKLDSIMEAIGELSDSDFVKNLIREGESQTLEFKESFGHNVENNKYETYLQELVIKTIAAFLNTKGGYLLIGVHDSGRITGINAELEKHHWPKVKKNIELSINEKLSLAKDEFIKRFKNKMKDTIGVQNYLNYDSQMIAIEEKIIFLVKCRKANQPVFVRDKDFFIRTNPATDKLDGSKLHQYIKNRFNE